MRKKTSPREKRAGLLPRAVGEGFFDWIMEIEILSKELGEFKGQLI